MLCLCTNKRFSISKNYLPFSGRPTYSGILRKMRSDSKHPRRQATRHAYMRPYSCLTRCSWSSGSPASAETLPFAHCGSGNCLGGILLPPLPLFKPGPLLARTFMNLDFYKEPKPLGHPFTTHKKFVTPELWHFI